MVRGRRPVAFGKMVVPACARPAARGLRRGRRRRRWSVRTGRRRRRGRRTGCGSWWFSSGVALDRRAGHQLRRSSADPDPSDVRELGLGLRRGYVARPRANEVFCNRLATWVSTVRGDRKSRSAIVGVAGAVDEQREHVHLPAGHTEQRASVGGTDVSPRPRRVGDPARRSRSRTRCGRGPRRRGCSCSARRPAAAGPASPQPSATARVQGDGPQQARHHGRGAEASSAAVQASSRRSMRPARPAATASAYAECGRVTRDGRTPRSRERRTRLVATIVGRRAEQRPEAPNGAAARPGVTDQPRDGRVERGVGRGQVVPGQHEHGQGAGRDEGRPPVRTSGLAERGRGSARSRDGRRRPRPPGRSRRHYPIMAAGIASGPTTFEDPRPRGTAAAGPSAGRVASSRSMSMPVTLASSPGLSASPAGGIEQRGVVGLEHVQGGQVRGPASTRSRGGRARRPPRRPVERDAGRAGVAEPEDLGQHDQGVTQRPASPVVSAPATAASACLPCLVEPARAVRRVGQQGPVTGGRRGGRPGRRTPRRRPIVRPARRHGRGRGPARRGRRRSPRRARVRRPRGPRAPGRAGRADRALSAAAAGRRRPRPVQVVQQPLGGEQAAAGALTSRQPEQQVGDGVVRAGARSSSSAAAPTSSGRPRASRASADRRDSAATSGGSTRESTASRVSACRQRRAPPSTTSRRTCSAAASASSTSGSGTPVTRWSSDQSGSRPSTAAPARTRRWTSVRRASRSSTRPRSVGGTSEVPAPPRCRSTSSSTRKGSPSARSSSTVRVAASSAPRVAASSCTAEGVSRASRTEVTPGSRASPSTRLDGGPSSRTVPTTHTGNVETATATWVSTAHESASAQCRSSSTTRHGRPRPTTPRKRATASPSTSPGSTPVSAAATAPASCQSGSRRLSGAAYGPRAEGVTS